MRKTIIDILKSSLALENSNPEVSDLEIIVGTKVLCNKAVMDPISLETGSKDDWDGKINILIFKQVLT